MSTCGSSGRNIARTIKDLLEARQNLERIQVELEEKSRPIALVETVPLVLARRLKRVAHRVCTLTVGKPQERDTLWIESGSKIDFGNLRPGGRFVRGRCELARRDLFGVFTHRVVDLVGGEASP